MLSTSHVVIHLHNTIVTLIWLYLAVRTPISLHERGGHVGLVTFILKIMCCIIITFWRSSKIQQVVAIIQLQDRPGIDHPPPTRFRHPTYLEGNTLDKTEIN